MARREQRRCKLHPKRSGRKGLSYFLKIPKKVRNLDPSLWGSSGVAAAGGDGGDDDMFDVKQQPRRGFQRAAAVEGLAS